MVTKKDIRLSTDRVATYAQKMKSSGHKQFSFFLSPQAHESLKNLTISEKKLGATMGATAQNLLNLLHHKEFIYLAIFNESELSSEEREAAIMQAIEYLQLELTKLKREIAAHKRQYDMSVLESEILDVNADEFNI